MASFGGPRSDFNDSPLIGGGLAGGMAIGSLLLCGVDRYIAAKNESRRRAAIKKRQKRDAFNRAAVDYLEGRLNAQIDVNRTQALVIIAQRKVMERHGLH